MEFFNFILSGDLTTLLEFIELRMKDFVNRNIIRNIVINLCKSDFLERWTSEQAYEEISKIKLLKNLQIIEYPTIAKKEQNLIAKSRFIDKIEIIKIDKIRGLIVID